jgi:signal transduction histidine kinase
MLAPNGHCTDPRGARMSAENVADPEEVVRRASARLREAAAVNRAMMAGLSAEGADACARAMTEILGRDLGLPALTLFMIEGPDLVSKARFGQSCAPDRISIGMGVEGTAAAHRRTLVVTHADEPGPEQRGHRSEMATPIVSRGELMGILLAQSPRRWAFDEAAVGTTQRAAEGVGAVLRAHRDRGDLVAVISHELRAPLTAIHGSVRTLIRGRHRLSEAEAAGFLRVIDRQAARMVRLVEDLTFTTAFEAGRLRLFPRAVQLRAYLTDVVSSFGSDSPRIRLAVRGEDAPVMVDPVRAEQIITNLVQNALKFSPPDRLVDLIARVRRGDLELRVRDEGVGIPSEDLPQIFDRFHRGRGSARTGGSGLGLFVTRQLVRAMGGHISVATTPGHGSMFTVWIPASEGAPHPKP